MSEDRIITGVSNKYDFKKVGVEVVSSVGGLKLRCVRCRRTWKAAARYTGRHAPGYWYCPGGCNHPQKQQAAEGQPSRSDEPPG